jgi:predicted PurR-regulated permease PerM
VTGEYGPSAPDPADPAAGRSRKIRRISLAVVIGTFLLVLLFAPSVLFLLFGSILLATALRGGGGWIADRTGLSRLAGLAVFTLLVLAVIVGFFAFAAPGLAAQFDELARQIPDAIEAVRAELNHVEWIRRMMEDTESKDLLGSLGVGGQKVMAAIAGVAAGAANAVLVLFLALYLAISPGLYRRGFLALLAPSLRPGAGHMLDEAAVALRGWMRAQAVSMAAVGFLTWLGYFLLGLPLAGILGFLAGLLAFIPNLGPILGAAPAVLIALSEGPGLALWVIGVVVAVQTVESYLLTPYLQNETVHLPPALTIAVQVLFGVLYGTAGLALATPLTAAALRVGRIFYVRGWLEKERTDSSR